MIKFRCGNSVEGVQDSQCVGILFTKPNKCSPSRLINLFHHRNLAVSLLDILLVNAYLVRSCFPGRSAVGCALGQVLQEFTRICGDLEKSRTGNLNGKCARRARILLIGEAVIVGSPSPGVG
jgi:hypothetical protein